MKLAASNIGWKKEEESAVAALMAEKGFAGVEVAPAKIGSEPIKLKDGEISSYRAFWNDHGIQVVAMQALLFGSTGLALFESPAQRQQLLDYLKRIIELGSLLGAGALVFGSPKNRKRHGLEQAAAQAIAVPFFKELGDYAHAHGTHLCLEPNPPIYDCDYLTTTAEVIALVKQVDSPGLRPHLDSAVITLAQDPPELLLAHQELLAHYHASEAYLQPVISNAKVDHQRLGTLLQQCHYQGYVSIEMKEVAPEHNNLEALSQAMDFVQKVYGN